jgi:hypothetical protein
MSLAGVDMNVAREAYSVAREMKATPKATLALFEAGLVESGVRNLNYGDRDSVGWLQQRPSQGWKSPMDVKVSTRSFLERALKNEKAKPTLTAGKLAQSVQISAYPDKYDQREADARALLAKLSGSSTNPITWIPIPIPGIPGGTIPIPTNPGDVLPDGLVGAVSGAADALKGMVSGVASVGTLATQLTKLALPNNFVRLVTGILGIVLIFFGITILGRQVKNG